MVCCDAMEFFKGAFPSLHKGKLGGPKDTGKFLSHQILNISDQLNTPNGEVK